MKESTIKEFLKGTRNNAQITLYYGDFLAFDGTYLDFKKSGKEYFEEVVCSWDACDCIDKDGNEFTSVSIGM